MQHREAAPRRQAGPSRSLLRAAGCCLVVFSLGAGCSRPQEPLFVQLLEPCTSEEGPSSGYCGNLETPEDPQNREGRSISLKVVVLPALRAEPRPDPVFFLAGGPGQGAASIAARIAPLFDEIRRSRDVVFVDQRGSGDSNRLECAFHDDAPDFQDPPPLSAEDVLACIEKLDADPRFYTTPIAMDDLDRVREWLGYERVNTIGGSYGTRAALVYLRRHPDRVRSIVLDGAAPMDMSLPLYFARDSQRALDHLIHSCREYEGCNSRFPELGPRLTALLSDLERNPRAVEIRHPRTGEQLRATVNRRLVAGTLRGALYSPLASSLIPLAIDRAEDEDFGPLTALALMSEGLQEEMADGMFFAVTCSEDFPRLSAEAAAAAAEGTFTGLQAFESQAEVCAHWPRGELAPNYHDPVQSDAPALVLSGELDPVTPPSWGDSVAEHLPNSVHVVAAGTGHGVMGAGCGMRLISRFLDAGSAQDLDTSCLESRDRPPFFLNRSGPYLPLAEGSDL